MYKALYRQYRPFTFDDVYGQETIVQTLRNSIKNKSYSHAYMFFGPRGTGKTSISKIFARSLNCLEPVDGNSCGKCKNCLNSYEKECVDIIEIDAASNNGVDEIRELKNKISLVPSELKYKVYIIDEVHMLSIGAFNALLKTLEEPPEHVIFILATTDPQKVPETIISRCQCFSFKRISTDKIASNLKKICDKEKIDIDDSVIDEISYSCDGGMRDALSSLDQLRSYSDSKITLDDYANVNGSLTNAELASFFSNIFNSEYSLVLNSIKKYNEQGKNLITILEKLMRFMRDKIVKFYTDNIPCEFDVLKIHKLVSLINEKLVEIKKSSNPVIYIEMILLEFMNDSNVNSQPVISNKVDSGVTNKPEIKPVGYDEKTLKPLKNKEIVDVEDNKKITTKEDVTSNYDASSSNENSNLNNPQLSVNKITNLDEIIKIRVHNTLAKANKQLLMKEISNIDIFNDYTFDSDIGYLACSILDSKIRAVSEDNIIISFEYDSIVKQNLAEIHKLNDVYNQITNSNKKIAIISDAYWDDIKNDYIKTIKSGGSYELEDEPAEIFIEEKNDDIISNNAVQIFGADIVEIK
ncbi:MAG: DNA polymerase III subunit gamma/tau [Bacilli bacterium]|nr:DNA polymerase III subunit gamma/tau [Bacilli bacterium]